MYDAASKERTACPIDFWFPFKSRVTHIISIHLHEKVTRRSTSSNAVLHFDLGILFTKSSQVEYWGAVLVSYLSLPVPIHTTEVPAVMFPGNSDMLPPVYLVLLQHYLRSSHMANQHFLAADAELQLAAPYHTWIHHTR